MLQEAPQRPFVRTGFHWGWTRGWLAAGSWRCKASRSHGSWGRPCRAGAGFPSCSVSTSAVAHLHHPGCCWKESSRGAASPRGLSRLAAWVQPTCGVIFCPTSARGAREQSGTRGAWQGFVQAQPALPCPATHRLHTWHPAPQGWTLFQPRSPDFLGLA